MMSMSDLSANDSGVPAEVVAGGGDDVDAALKKATSEIERAYFKVKRVAGSSADRECEYVYRERVYCYELYHQLRRTHGNFGLELTTHAEIDKNGQEHYNKENPDFLIHKPGSNENNFLIMEVKVSAGTTCKKKKWAEDIKKIVHFMQEHGYKRGVFLLFGSEDPSSCLRESANLFCQHNNGSDPSRIEVCKIEVWWHKNPKEEATKLPNPWGYGATSR